MNKTAISWTDFSLNPIRWRNTETGKVGWYCQKISAGCANCYAETLNNRFGAMVRYDVPSASKGEFFLDMKMLGKLYKEKKPSRVFAFDMTDWCLDLIPDWMIAVCFYVFLDNPHTIQLLTKRPERAVNWTDRFNAAQQTDEFKALAHEHQATWGSKTFTDPWGANIWMGASVESAATVHRIETLRRVPAQTRFISAEPLLGAWGAVDLSGVHQVIVGGESGAHMWMTDSEGKRVKNEQRWMRMEWAREIKSQCVEQRTAVFFKQQSGVRTEMDAFLIEEDGSRWKWEQYPRDFRPPINLDAPPLPSAVVAESKSTDPASVSQFKQGDHYVMSADPDPIPPVPIERVEPDYADPFALPGNARVLSLWQPWATLLMIEQGKRIETRSWRTPFRGTLVIHAAKEWNKDTRQIANSEPFASVLRANGYDPNALPLGVALGTVQLENCVRAEDVRGVIGDQERAFGDFDDGRFGWLTSAPRLFRDPLPVAGEQGLKEWANYLAKIAPKAEAPAPAGLFLGQYVVVPDKDPALFHGVIRKLQDGEAMIDFNQQAVWAPYADVKPHPRHITTVYTARVDSRDSDVLDITVKSASTPEGKFFAPTWDMVNSVKSGAISETEYEHQYEALLRGRYAENANVLKKMLYDRRRIVFTCYCGAPPEFCHRHLAVNVLEKIGAKFGFTVLRGGELEASKPVREESTVQLALFDMKTYA